MCTCACSWFPSVCFPFSSRVLEEPSKNLPTGAADVARSDLSRTESLSSSPPASPETGSSLDDIGEDADRDV